MRDSFFSIFNEMATLPWSLQCDLGSFSLHNKHHKARASSSNHNRHCINMSGNLWRVEIWPGNSGQRTVRDKGDKGGHSLIKQESKMG